MKKYSLPTGYLIVDEYEKGKLETLSIGDYGKQYNVKADFLGYNKEIEGVPNTYCMPLSEKWVVTLSTQYGCVMKCNFCDVPNVPWGGNVTQQDLFQQLENAINCFPSVKYTERLNIHFARMGEPIFNDNVFKFSRYLFKHKKFIEQDLGLKIEVIHPVLTTSLPKALKSIESRLLDWCDIKNNVFNGQAGLQFSINSTSEEQRETMFGNMSLSLVDFAKIAEKLPSPISRKYCLNFAYSTDFEIDAKLLASLFDSNKFMCKITPIHNNNACNRNGIATIGGYDSYLPYKKPEEDLKEAGFDVLVFVPSIDEEDGLVTCGNAILGGSQLKSQEEGILKIHGI
jgi:23S rRNA (adenine2503-C2)-methyltransferase